MIECIIVGFGGFIGSVFRYLAGSIPLKKSQVFPVNTLIVNVIGAFLIGVIAAVFSKNADLDRRLLLLLKTGICGGFTTFSSLALETFDLIRSGRWCAAAIYMLLSSVLGVAAVYFGMELVR